MLRYKTYSVVHQLIIYSFICIDIYDNKWYIELKLMSNIIDQSAYGIGYGYKTGHEYLLTWPKYINENKIIKLFIYQIICFIHLIIYEIW